MSPSHSSRAGSPYRWRRGARMASVTCTLPDCPNRAARRARLERTQQVEQLDRRADDEIRGFGEAPRRVAGHDRNPHRHLAAVEAAEAVEVGRVVARVEAPAQAAVFEQ